MRNILIRAFIQKIRIIRDPLLKLVFSATGTRDQSAVLILHLLNVIHNTPEERLHGMLGIEQSVIH